MDAKPKIEAVSKLEFNHSNRERIDRCIAELTAASPVKFEVQFVKLGQDYINERRAVTGNEPTVVALRFYTKDDFHKFLKTDWQGIYFKHRDLNPPKPLPVRIDIHDEQEKELKKLIGQKLEDKVYDEADSTACDEDEDCLFLHRIEVLEAGLKKGEEIWAVQMDEYNYCMFIGRSFAEVRSRVEKLPNKQ